MCVMMADSEWLPHVWLGWTRDICSCFRSQAFRRSPQPCDIETALGSEPLRLRTPGYHGMQSGFDVLPTSNVDYDRVVSA